MAAETAAERLHALYVDELRQSLLPPVHPMVNGRQIEALIQRARTAEPAACTEPDATTWIWSDLHLGHEHSRSVFGRPFPTAAAADEAMMEAWYEEVAEGETIICLGDVTLDGEALAHHQQCWRKAPGTKWLVLGNHDVVIARIGQEITLKCFHRPGPDRIELQPRSSNPEHTPIVIDAQTADWEIAGVVVGAMIGARPTAGC